MSEKKKDIFRFLTWKYDNETLILLQAYIKSLSYRKKEEDGLASVGEYFKGKLVPYRLAPLLHKSKNTIAKTIKEAENITCVKLDGEAIEWEGQMLEYDEEEDVTILLTDFGSKLSYQKIKQKDLQKIMEYIYSEKIDELDLKCYLYCLSMYKLAAGKYKPEITTKRICSDFNCSDHGTKSKKITESIKKLKNLGWINYEEKYVQGYNRLVYKKLFYVKENFA